MVNKLFSLPLSDLEACRAFNRRVLGSSASLWELPLGSPASSVEPATLPLPRRDLRIVRLKSEWRFRELNSMDALYLGRGVRRSSSEDPSSGRSGKPECLSSWTPPSPPVPDLDCDFRLLRKLIDLGARNIGASCADLRSLGSERKNRRDVEDASGLDFSELLARNRPEPSWLFRAAWNSGSIDRDRRRRRYEDGADAISSSGV